MKRLLFTGLLCIIGLVLVVGCSTEYSGADEPNHADHESDQSDYAQSGMRAEHVSESVTEPERGSEATSRHVHHTEQGNAEHEPAYTSKHSRQSFGKVDQIVRGSNAGMIPVTIEIPAIGVQTLIEPVGLLADGHMDEPSTAEGVAWFEKGTRPGGYGNAVLAGHIDSRTGPSVFYDLEKLEAGDEIVLTDEMGGTLTFVVVKQSAYPRQLAPLHDIFGYTHARNLNLITCTGTFDSDAGTHDHRLVVYATLSDDGS